MLVVEAYRTLDLQCGGAHRIPALVFGGTFILPIVLRRGLADLQGAFALGEGDVVLGRAL